MKKIGLLLLAATLGVVFAGCTEIGKAILKNGIRQAAQHAAESVMEYVGAETYTAGNFTYAAADVRAVAVSWVGGSVTLAAGTGDVLHAAENGTLTDAQQMRWRIKDGVLEIMYCASGYAGLFPPQSKQLTLEIPAGAAVTVDSVSASVRGTALTAGDIGLSTVSGSVSLTDTAAEKIRLGSVSGAVGGAGLTCDAANVETVSGSVRLGLSACGAADINTVSGSVRLSVPTALGATFRYETVSGNLHCDDYRVTGDRCIYGNGNCAVSVETVSGGFTLTDQ